jgi:anti-sigma regulatory factor (Ser/Thr protein kinase)
MAFDPRARRSQIRVRVQLEDERETEYYGFTQDISETGFSAFLRCKEDFVVEEVSRNASVEVHFAKLESLFFDRVFRTVFNLEIEVKPFRSEVVRLENSWMKGFEVFVACRFIEIDEANRAVLADHLEAEKARQPRAEVVADAEDVFADLDLQGGETLRFEFPGRFFYLAIFRDMVERLAMEIGFSDIDCFKVKVAADEVFTNAFKHGCPAYAENQIVVAITLDRQGIFVRVRDEAGVPFDHRRFKEWDERCPDATRTGLCLVNQFMDDWQVETREGEYTEISFFKSRERSSETTEGSDG